MVELRTPTVAPIARPAGQVSNESASALARAGRAAQGVADKFTEFYEKEAAIENDLLLATMQSDWTKTFKERQGSRGFAKGMLTDYDSYTAKVLEGSPARGKDKLELSFQKYRIRLNDQAMAKEAAFRAAAKSRAVSAARQARGNALLSDPSLLGEYMEGASKKDKSYFLNLALSAQTETDPTLVNEQVVGGKWDAVLSPSQKLSFMKRSKNKMDTIERQQQTKLKADQSQYVADVLSEGIAFTEVNGAPPPGDAMSDDTIDIISGGNAEWADAVKKKRDTAISHAEDFHAVGMASPAEIETILSDANAAVETPGDTRGDVNHLSSLIKAVSERDTAIRNDSAGYVIRMDQAAADQYDLYAVADPELKPEIAQNIGAYMDVTYDLIGVPEELRTYLSKRMALAKVNELNGSGNDVAAQALEQFLGDWSGKESAVIEQLRKEGLAPEFVVAMQQDGSWLQGEIIGLRGLKEKDLKDLVDPDVSLEITKEVNERMMPFSKAVEAGGGPETTTLLNEQYSVVRRLALKRAASGGDASTIVSEIVAEMYPQTIIESSDRHIIIPRGVDAPQFERALDFHMTDESLLKLPFPVNPNIANEVNQPLFVESLKDNGFWVTNSKGTGAVLKWYDPNSRGEYKILNHDGTDYEVMFGDELPEKARTIGPDLRGGFGFGQ